MKRENDMFLEGSGQRKVVGASYSLEIEYSGDQIKASLYDRTDEILLDDWPVIADGEDGVISGLTGKIGFNIDQSNAIIIDRITVIPEPSTLALLGLGGLLLLKRRSN